MLSEPEVREARRMIKEQVDIMKEQVAILEIQGDQQVLLKELGIYGMLLSGFAVAVAAILKDDLSPFKRLNGTVMEIVNSHKESA